MSGEERERLARLSLSRLFEPGEPRICRAVAEAGATAVLQTVLSSLDDSGGRRPDDPSADAGGRVQSIDPARDLERAQRHGIRFVVPGDEEWPAGSADLVHVPAVNGHGGPPLGLWVRGPVPLTELVGSVAVVGSRSATSYGLELAREIAAEVGASGRVVVSGGAMGIDAQAHAGALAARGRTIAFLAGGVDRPYPPRNADMLQHLAQHGAVVSEAPPGSTSYPNRFLARNRLIAATSAATVVVEAAIRSGALSTARWAAHLSRPVLGVPGPVTSAASQGVHQLIRSGAALLVTGGREVLEVVADAGSQLVEEPRGPETARDHLSARQRKLLAAVPVARPAPAEAIARNAGVGLLEAVDSLDRLAQREFVERLGHGWILGERGRSA